MYTAEYLERIKNNPARLKSRIERLAEYVGSLEKDLEYAREELAYVLRHPETEDQTNVSYWEKYIGRKLRMLEDKRGKLEQLTAVAG